MRIAVDAMGGDHAPGRLVDGALAAARHLGIGIDLVGRSDLIRPELARHVDASQLDVRVVEATDVIAMEESPIQALRRKPRASIRVAAELVAAGDAAPAGVLRVARSRIVHGAECTPGPRVRPLGPEPASRLFPARGRRHRRGRDRLDRADRPLEALDDLLSPEQMTRPRALVS